MGPLEGIKVIELAGIGPGPMCAMLLADLGADVLRIERPGPADLGIKRPLEYNLLLRNRESVFLDLKSSEDRDFALQLIGRADALIEGFRPGVCERLGLGPDTCMALNPRLVFGRVTGWGQDGPLAQAAAHDLNYVALTGIVDTLGRAGQPPTVPLNVLGDYAGGSLYLAFGILAGIINARSTGKGQVVDAAIVDGVAHLLTSFYGLLEMGLFKQERGTNIVDSGAYFYDVYECADQKWISIGAIERRFHDALLDRLGIDNSKIGPQMDASNWEQGRKILTDVFKTKTQAQWCELLEGTDVCFAPVLTLSEAPEHPHMQARGTYADIAGVRQPKAVPRFSGTPPATPRPPMKTRSVQEMKHVLSDWLDEDEIARYCATTHRHT